MKLFLYDLYRSNAPSQVAEGLFAIERLKHIMDERIVKLLADVAEGLFAIERLKLTIEQLAEKLQQVMDQGVLS